MEVESKRSKPLSLASQIPREAEADVEAVAQAELGVARVGSCEGRVV